MLLVGPTILALILATAVFVWGPAPLRVSVLGATLIAALLLVVGIAFALRYDLFALAAFGNRRLFNYAAVPFVLVLIAAGEWVLWLLRSKIRTPSPSGVDRGFRDSPRGRLGDDPESNTMC